MAIFTWSTSRPETQTTSDTSTVVSFSTAANDAPTQDFSQFWTKGFFNGIAADGTNIYAVGASHPNAGLTHDVGGLEVKTMLATFNANGIAGNNPAPATDFTDNNFFGYGGVEIFLDVLVTTQGGNSVIYAVGHGQPNSYGAYIIASYDSNGNLLHTATEPLPVPGFSVARDVVEFNGQIWAVGFTQHSGDAVGKSGGLGHRLQSDLGRDLQGHGRNHRRRLLRRGGDRQQPLCGRQCSKRLQRLPRRQIQHRRHDRLEPQLWRCRRASADEAVALNGHLYVVGYTTDGSGNTDGVLMEINTADGSVISTTSYGGALYDSFNSITTDGHYLYVAGESKSFTNGGKPSGRAMRSC